MNTNPVAAVEAKLPRNTGTFKNIGRLVLKVEPGEKLIWRCVDGVWARYMVDAAVRS